MKKNENIYIENIEYFYSKKTGSCSIIYQDYKGSISCGSIITIHFNTIPFIVSIYEDYIHEFDKIKIMINSNNFHGVFTYVKQNLITDSHWLDLIEKTKQKSYKDGWNDHIKHIVDKI